MGAGAKVVYIQPVSWFPGGSCLHLTNCSYFCIN